MTAAASPDLLSQKPTAPPLETAEQDIALDNAWQAFQHKVGGTWVIDRHPATGTPQAIYGTGLALAGWRESSEQQARVHGDAALVQWHDLLGLGASDFRVQIAGKMGGTWVLVYEQSFHGVPVIGGRADVRIHESGTISLLGSVAWPIPATFNTVPVLNAANAELLAWRAAGVVPNNVPQPAKQGTRLVIWGDVNAGQRAPFFLAWEVGISAVDAEGIGPIGRQYIDALTGLPLHYQSDKHDCGDPACNHHHGEHGNGPELIGPPAPPLDVSGTVMAWTRTGLNAADPLVNIPLPGLKVVVPGVGTAITDANGLFSIPSALTAPVSVTVNMNGVHCQLIAGASAATSTQSLTPGTPASYQLLTSAATSAEAAHTSTYWWIYQANEWIRTILGNTTQMNTADSVRPTVNIASTCNAYYTNNTVNFYAAGGSCNNTGFSTVVAHEWGHGIDDRYGGISNNNGDGLSEAWGDTIAMYLVGDPVTGRGFNVGATGGIRTGTNTRQFTSLTPSTEVHSAGEVYMGYCWKVRDRLITTQGAGPGTAIANTIVIGSIIANATNQTNAVREIFIADDNDGNLLNGTPHYAELTYAAAQHSMPYPAIQIGSITHTPLANTVVQLTPRLINAIAAPTSGSINAVRLHYNDGTGAQVRPMLPSGLQDGYRALLPGVLSGNTVTYHLEADHSTGPIIRLPATGEYSTTTLAAVTNGPETRLFFENFDTGAPGWTHGTVAGADDWQIGPPVGRSGTSSGVGWADPAAAYSAPNCAGNDILAGTGSNFNGSYPANVQNWLRAPVLNMAGQFGLKLRFRRWLTVEEGIYDQAQIRVNNVVVWQNQANGHTIDTSWVLFEVAIPQADNNPAVSIEWRLISDGGLQLGGWTIDDVEVVSSGLLIPLNAQLRVTPAQVSIGAPMNLGVVIRPNTPFLLGLGDTAGPTSIPGIPTMQVGGGYVTFPAWTDAAGNFNWAFTAPATPAAINTFWYSQALTIDPAFNFVTSNAWINLFQN